MTTWFVKCHEFDVNVSIYNDFMKKPWFPSEFVNEGGIFGVSRHGQFESDAITCNLSDISC